MTIIRRFDVELGTCVCCGRQSQSGHPLQTSNSLRVGEDCRLPRCRDPQRCLSRRLLFRSKRGAPVARPLPWPCGPQRPTCNVRPSIWLGETVLELPQFVVQSRLRHEVGNVCTSPAGRRLARRTTARDAAARGSRRRITGLLRFDAPLFIGSVLNSRKMNRSTGGGAHGHRSGRCTRRTLVRHASTHFASIAGAPVLAS